MAWWEGYEETRVLMAAGTTESGNDVGQLISLRHPKSDGGFYTATPVDPVFIFLPIFEEARMKKGDNPGKFRLLDDIIFIEGYPGYHKLLSIAENCMQLVCKIKEVGSSKLFRLDDSKVLAWFYHKVCQLKQTLSTLDHNYAAWEEKDMYNFMTDAVSVLGEYVKDEPWLKLLSDRLRIVLQKQQEKIRYRISPDCTGSNLGPCNVVHRKRVRVRLSLLKPEGKRRRRKWRQNHITSEICLLGLLQEGKSGTISKRLCKS